MMFKKLFLLLSIPFLSTFGCISVNPDILNIKTSCEDTGHKLFGDDLTTVQREQYFGQNLYHKNFNWKLKIWDVQQAYAPPDSLQYKDPLFKKGYNIKFVCGDYFVDSYVSGFAVDDQALNLKKGQVYNVKGTADSYMNFGNGEFNVFRADVSIDDIKPLPLEPSSPKKIKQTSSLNKKKNVQVN